MFRFNSIYHPRYRAVLLFCILTIIISLFAGVAISDERLNGVLEGILKAYGGLPGLTVDYQREIITKSMAMLGDQMTSDVASGRFLFKPPHYLKIEQDTPEPETVTTDGETIWWYIPAEEIVYEYPAGKLGKELRMLIDIFEGLNNATDSFDITILESENSDTYDLRLTPKVLWEEIDHMILSLDRDNFHIQVIEIHNMVGGITRFRLGDFSAVDNLDKDLFVFVAPEGVEVIREE